MLGASTRAIGRLCRIRAICRAGGRGLFSASSTTLIHLPHIRANSAAPTFRFFSSVSHCSGSNRDDDGGETNGLSNREVNAYSAIELALDSVVKVFTVSSSPNYMLPWQNKSQRETMGSGIWVFRSFIFESLYFFLVLFAVSVLCISSLLNCVSF